MAKEVKTTKKKFKRAGGSKGDSTNEEGNVVVKIILQDPKRASGYPLRGNITKTFTVKEADVLNVHDAIIKELFG